MTELAGTIADFLFTSLYVILSADSFVKYSPRMTSAPVGNHVTHESLSSADRISEEFDAWNIVIT